jgi:Uma2 family endonuclease
MSALPAVATPVSSTPSAAPDIQTRMTLAVYFALERRSDIRHEYVNGYIRAMAGESPQHNRIARNFCVRLENAFGERLSESFIENIRVHVSPTRYRYPDVVALCGNAQFDTETPPSLLNPSVIVEVLSPSTAENDRTEKFMEYRQIEGLTDYILIEQDRMLVVHFARQSATQWVVTEYSRADDTLTFASLEVSLTLADIYRKVVFDDSTPSTPEEASPPTS